MRDKKGLQIKLAFINACHSQRMGEIFIEVGVPIAVCVQSNETIDDDACKLFSKEFYKKLVDGDTIKSAFRHAQKSIKIDNPGKFKPCCCAHPHADDCWWY